MGLALYYDDEGYVQISVDDDLTNPLTTIHDGKSGDIITKQIFIRNDDSLLWFSNIRIAQVHTHDPHGEDLVYAETGWGIKLYYGDNEPSQGEWEDIDWGNFIDIAAIGDFGSGDTSTYYSIWYLVTCPPNSPAQIKTDLVLNVSFTENAVGN